MNLKTLNIIHLQKISMNMRIFIHKLKNKNHNLDIYSTGFICNLPDNELLSCTIIHIYFSRQMLSFHFVWLHIKYKECMQLQAKQIKLRISNLKLLRRLFLRTFTVLFYNLYISQTSVFPTYLWVHFFLYILYAHSVSVFQFYLFNDTLYLFFNASFIIYVHLQF